MKRLFLVAVGLTGILAVKAQVMSEAISATLQKGDTTTVYYGTDALKTAMDNAADGSVITLSSGTFAPPSNITKSVRIYGAGFEEDTITGVTRTYLSGGLTMNGVDGIHVDNFSMEGVYINGDININNADDDQIENVKLVKCRFGHVYFRENSVGIIMRQCDIEGNISGNSTVASALMVQNCYVSGEINGFNTSSSVVIDHCVLAAADGSSRDLFHGPYVYRNSIINRFLSTGAVAVNCIGGQSFITNRNNNNAVGCYYDYKSWGALFADGQNDLKYSLSNSVPRSWALADPDTYKGDDGTPVGVTGGDYPWDKIPSTPRIVSSSIASKTVDGKLHVTVKAEAKPVTE